MHEFVAFNRKIVPAEKCFLRALSNSALYGKGVFTTIAVYDSKPFLWEKHWRRLNANAKKTDIDLPAFSECETRGALAEIIARNGLLNGRVRLTFYDETASRLWQCEAKGQTSILIQTADFRAVPENLRLTASPYAVNSKSPLAGVKSCNYLENIAALENAKENGFDEAVRLNERGEIASAATANIFWKRGEKIYTPALETGCLDGTTRAFVCENFPVAEVKANPSELNDADEIFLTSAGIGVAPVAEFQGKKLSASAQEIARLINAETRAK